LIWNKSDIAPFTRRSLPAPVSEDIAANIISFSAKTGEGIKELFAAVVSSVRAEEDVQTASLGSLRQKKLIDTAIAALEESFELAVRNEPLDLIAPCVREAVNALGEITGEVSTADILEQMFSQFCVGK
jgi:tRNA modification GTPase